VTDEHGTQDFALDDTNIYWVNYGGGAVQRAPLAGGTPTTIASGQSSPAAIAIDGTSIYWQSGGSDPPGPSGAVFSAPKAGGSPTLLASAQQWVKDLRADTKGLYWVAVNLDAVMTLSKGGEPAAIAKQHATWSLAIDDANVYWGVGYQDATDGKILRTAR
jgi:hypothetical protein